MSRRHPDRDRVGGAVDARGRTGAGGPTTTERTGDADARVRTLADRVEELEAELERRERRHRDVVRRYERLLAEARGETGRDEGDGCEEADRSGGGVLSRLGSLLGR